MSEPHQTRERLFHAAAELKDPAQRAAFLDAACGQNQQLREEIEELLRHDVEAGSFLDKPAAAEDLTGPYQPVSEGPGTRIGPYKLLQRIGEGGFGVVYMAEQQEPVRRKVALKIIKPGMDTREVIARFESERQALALMDHPNVARVFDAGATDSSRPFFVMELVRGVPITEFCDKNHLPPNGRLELFKAVCSAVQHAHQKGIIHRDLKPSNILVTLHDGQPVPKVIDFGVAKATNQQLTERTLFTAYGQMVGTPAYMSPEQAEMSGLDIDTRSDIYSLGVLLYELLTGTTPLESKRLRQAGYAEMQRLIRDEEPPRPSTRLSSLGGEATVMAGNRGTDAKRLAQMLRGDLDWIVMKALEKDRNRRYETPSAFAQDIERFLKNEAILARPPSALYKLSKFARRNREAVLTAALVIVLLVGGILGTGFGLIAAKKSEEEARREAERARDAELLADRRLTDAQQERDIATDARSEAETSASRLQTALKQEDSRRLAAQAMAVLPTNPGLALLLARAGAEKSPARSAPHNNALLAALRECREVRTILPPVVPAAQDRTGRPRIIGLQITPDGQRAVAVSVPANDTGCFFKPSASLGSASVYDLTTGKLTATMRLPGLAFATMAISPDGRLLAAAADHHVVVQYDDGQTVGYTDRAVRLWDMQTGKEIRVLTGHKDRVVSIGFDAKGERLVTASWDKTARIWDVASGKVQHELADGDASLEFAEFSPDGRRVLTVGTPGVCGTQEIEPALRGHGFPGPIQPEKVVIDPPVRTESTIRWIHAITGQPMTGDGRNALPRLWDAGTGRRLAILAPDKANYGSSSNTAVGFSPDSSRVVTMSNEKAALWKSADGKQIKVALWKSADGKLTFERPIYEQLPEEMLSEGDCYLRVVRTSGPIIGIGADRGSNLLIWQLDKEQNGWQRSPGARHRIPSGRDSRGRRPFLLDGSLDGEPLVAWSSGYVVSIRAADGSSDLAVLRGHTDTVTAAAFLPNSKRIVTASIDGTLRMWDFEPTRHAIIEFKDPNASQLGSGRFLPGSQQVLTAPAREKGYWLFSGKSLALWNVEKRARALELATEELLATTPVHKQLLGGLYDFDVSPDGERLVTVHRDLNPCTDPKLEPQASPLYTPVRMWECRTGKLLFALKELRRGVSTAQFSPDGKLLLTFADGNYLYGRLGDKNQLTGNGSTGKCLSRVDIWNAQNGEHVRALVPEAMGGGDFALWSPDGKRVLTNLLTNADNRAADIYEADTGKVVCQLKQGTPWFDNARFSPDGKMVLGYRIRYNGDQQSLDVWDCSTGEKRFTLTQTASVTSAQFSSDSRSILTTSADGSAWIWNSSTGELRRTIRGHELAVSMGQFSPDGQWIATASMDGTTRIWSAETGDEWMTLPVAHGVEFATVEFSSDSKSVLTVSTDGAARIWPIDPLPLAAARQPRELTAEERARYQVSPTR